MKKISVFFLIGCVNFAFAQNIKQIEIKLDNAFERIVYWSTDGKEKDFRGDSLVGANNKFENLLYKMTSTKPETLKKNGLVITTSQDGKFRIYNWDTRTGGTMHFYRTIFQYQTNNKKVFAEKVEHLEGDPGFYYYQINDISSNNETYYLTQNIAILGTALSYHRLNVFAIQNNKLNQNAKLIKTKSGLTGQLSYEVDLSAKVNRDKEVTGYKIQYDSKTKTISFPLIQEDSKVTDKKIKYQFKGKYFEKI
jgi:hypothetical protein